jgi:hypothetical protein
MEDVAKLIVGAWRLVHSIIINADGKNEYPFGEDARGISAAAIPASRQCR